VDPDPEKSDPVAKVKDPDPDPVENRPDPEHWEKVNADPYPDLDLGMCGSGLRSTSLIFIYGSGTCITTLF